MAGLVSLKGGCRGARNAVDEVSICATGTGFTNAGRERETEQQRQPTDWAEFGNDSSMVASAVPQESIGDVENKGEFLPEAQIDAHWNNIGIMNRDPPLSETNNWASFSPVTTSSNSHLMDTSHWAQNVTDCTANSGENPVINTDYKCPDEHTGVGDVSPGWQEFSLSGSYDTSNSWFETVQSESDNADCIHQPVQHTHRTDDTCQTHTCDECTALPHHHPSCVAVFRQCFTSHTVGEGVPQMVSSECVRDWKQIRDSRFAWQYRMF